MAEEPGLAAWSGSCGPEASALNGCGCHHRQRSNDPRDEASCRRPCFTVSPDTVPTGSLPRSLRSWPSFSVADAVRERRFSSILSLRRRGSLCPPHHAERRCDGQCAAPPARRFAPPSALRCTLPVRFALHSGRRCLCPRFAMPFGLSDTEGRKTHRVVPAARRTDAASDVGPCLRTSLVLRSWRERECAAVSDGTEFVRTCASGPSPAHLSGCRFGCGMALDPPSRRDASGAFHQC